jgi:DNA-binding transcriptional LysR family regulator
VEGDLAGERQTLRGTIRATVPLVFGVLHLTPLILEFSRLHPEIRVDLDFNDRRVNLIEDGLDLGLRITGNLSDTAVARHLTTLRSVVVASPGYLAKHGEPRHPDDLRHHACLVYSLTARASWSFLIDGKPYGVDVAGPLVANNGSVLQEAAIQGLGIIHEPTFIAAEAIRAGQLVPILRDFATPALEMYAVFPGHRFVPQRVRAFVDFLADRLGPEPYWDKGL